MFPAKKTLAGLVVALTLIYPASALALTVSDAFNPSILIPDAAFADTKTFGGPEGIQAFLESKNSVLANTSPDFLVKLAEPSNSALKTALGDPQPNLGRLRTAAELIWDASVQSGINPQVTLVTLHKEQGLIGPVDQNRLQRALTHAMGFDCPDGSACGNLFPGFYYQLFGNVDAEGNRYLGATRSLMKSFTTPGGRGPLLNGAPAKVGSAVTLGNTLGDFDGIGAAQSVLIGNSATAALYRYTPHVFNGNYNFWRFFRSWFRYQNGALLRSTFDSTVYIIDDGQRRRLPQFVAAARGLPYTTATLVSPTELEDYPTGPTYGPADGTIISLSGNFYVFMNGIKRPASSFVITERKLDPAQIMPISPADAALFSEGPRLMPSEGTIIAVRGTYYRVGKDALQRFSSFTLKQYDAAKGALQAPGDEVALYPVSGYVPPKNGTLVKTAASGTYLVGEGRRLPLTSEIFKNRGYRVADVVTLESNEELASLPLGPVATPKEGTYFAMGKELFLFKNGAKHPIFAFVAKQRGITPDYHFDAGIVSGWPDGIALAPKDGTLVKGQSTSAVYLVENGQLRPLTATIYKLRGFAGKNIAVAADAEVSALAKDGYAEPPTNTYFSVKETGAFYRFQDGAKRRIFPLVATQRRMTPDYSFPQEVVDDWTEGKPVAPKDWTVLKADASDQLYVVVNTVMRPASAAALKRLGLAKAKVNVLPATDLAAFPKGALIAK